MRSVRKLSRLLLLCAVLLPACSRDQPAAPGLHSLSGPVLLTGYLSDSIGTFQGTRLVTDADGVAVELLYGNQVVARTLTTRGIYRFTGLGPGGYVTRVQVVGTVGDRTEILTIARDDIVVRDTLRVASVGDIYPIPNPFGTSARLFFDVPDTAYATVRILDMAGNLVRPLYTGQLLPGVRSVTWYANDILGQPVTQALYWATYVAGEDVRAQLLFR